MKRWWIATWPVWATLLVALLATNAWAQGNVRVRGQITAVDSKTLSIKSRDGRDVTVQLADDLTVSVPVAVALRDIKPGDYIGTTSKVGADGVAVAIDMHYLSPTVPEGQMPSYQGGGAVMTNAHVGSIVPARGQAQMTVEVKGVKHKILVPAGVPIVRAVPGTRSDLVAGQGVIVVAQASTDGTLTAIRIQVGKNGVQPI